MKIEELLISKKMGRELPEYQALFPHVSAGLQLRSKGMHVNKGDKVGFIFTASRHRNPLLRVRAISGSESNQEIPTEYDRDKYLELLLDAAETILAPFGFQRRLLGDGSARVTDWRKELRKEREQSIGLETDMAS